MLISGLCFTICVTYYYMNKWSNLCVIFVKSDDLAIVLYIWIVGKLNCMLITM